MPDTGVTLHSGEAETPLCNAIYWMLKRGVAYRDLGADHFDRIDRTRLARKLDELGFDVTLTRREAV